MSIINIFGKHKNNNKFNKIFIMLIIVMASFAYSFLDIKGRFDLGIMTCATSDNGTNIPKLYGVEDNGIYNKSVTINFENGNCYIDGIKIVNGYKLSEEGKYSLIVTDEAQNVSKVNFEIDKTAPVISGVENLKEYREPITITFNEGTAKINKTEFENGKMIYSNGEYLLEVTDMAGNVSEVKFTLRELSFDGILKRINKDPKNAENYLIYKYSLEKLGKLKENRLFVNGSLVNFRMYKKVEPVVSKDKIMVAMNFVADYLGIRNYWEDESKEYVMQDGDRKVTLKIDNDYANVNINGENKLEIPVVKVKDIVLVPIQFIVETFSAKFYWNPGIKEETGVIAIYRENKKPLFEFDKENNNNDNPNYPIITGVEDGQEYNRPVFITIKSGSYILDGTESISNISKYLFNTLDGRKFMGGIVMGEGVHTLIANVGEKISKLVKFTIDTTPPVIEGVQDGMVYNKSVRISFDDGKAMLNGKPFRNGKTISQDGDYEIFVMDKMGNSSSIDFTIDLLSTKNNMETKDDENADYYNKDIEIRINQEIKSMYIDDKEVNGEVKLTKEGIYILKTIYLDGSEKINKMIIDKTAPEIKDITAGRVYNTDKKVEFNEGKGSINGKEVNSGDIIQIDGKYDLQVIDKAGNKSEISFSIDKTPPIITGAIDGKLYYQPTKVYFSEGIGMCNNSMFLSGTEFKQPGEYNIHVRDYAGNNSTLRFNISALSLEEIMEKIKLNPKETEYYSVLAIKMEEKKYKGIKLFVNGVLLDDEKYSNIQPTIVRGRTFVPINIIIESFNAKVEWDEKTKTAYVKIGEKTIKMTQDSDIVYVDGKLVRIDVPIMIIKGRIMVPIRFISQLMEKYVYWLAYGQDLRIISVY